MGSVDQAGRRLQQGQFRLFIDALDSPRMAAIASRQVSRITLDATSSSNADDVSQLPVECPPMGQEGRVVRAVIQLRSDVDLLVEWR